MKKSPKTINGLMKHLRENNNISIKNSKQKNQLINQGYYHGYKAYRFYKTSNQRLPLKDYEEINQTIIYDSRLKALMYDKIMFIETALKNIALDVIINELHTDNISVLYEKGVTSYKNSPSYFNPDQKNKAQMNLFALQSKIQHDISEHFNDKDPKIIHFYYNNKYSYVPIWAIFEILTMGKFGQLTKSLTYDLRDKISKRLEIDSNIDTYRSILSNYIFCLTSLRNSIAHNGVVYDCRFNKKITSKTSIKFLQQKTNLKKINFDSIVDYIALISYFLKTLRVNKTEIKSFIKDYKQITNTYITNMPLNITNITITKGWEKALDILTRFIDDKPQQNKPLKPNKTNN